MTPLRCHLFVLLPISLIAARAAAQDVPAATTRPEINLRQTVTVDVVRKTKDAVVNISTTKTVTQRMSPFGRDADPFWQQFEVGDVVKFPANSLPSPRPLPEYRDRE